MEYPTTPSSTTSTSMSSIQVFREFIKRKPDGSCDASAVLTTPCYNLWLESRKNKPEKPEKSFQRILSAHITGMDGRMPFLEEEEKAVLFEVRKKQRWPAFRYHTTKFGEMGFRAKGFHEKRATMQIEQQAEDSIMSEEDEEEDTMPVGNSSQAFPQGSADDAFFQLVSSVFQQFQGVGINVKQSIHDVARMLLLSRGFFEPPTQEQAARLMETVKYYYEQQTNRRDPLIMVVDVTTIKYSDRYMLQSENSVNVWGKVSRKYGGCNHSLVVTEDCWGLVHCMTRAATNPNLAFGVSARMIQRNGMRFHGWVRMDPESGLFVFWGDNELST